MKLLANQVHMQGVEVLQADKVHKQEPQHVATRCTHGNHPYISSGKIMWHLPCHCYLCSDGCMCET